MLQFITAGSGAHSVDFTRHPLTKGDVLQVRPGQVHAFDSHSNHEALILVFRPETVTTESIGRLSVHLTAPFHLDCSEFELLLQLLEMMIKLEDKPEHQRLVSVPPALLQAVISGLDDSYAHRNNDLQSPSHHRALDLVFRFEHLLQQQSKRHSISDFCSALHVTQKTLGRACHRIRGMSPKKLIDHHFTLEAKRKLILSDDTIEEIAFSLGFSEATNFVKFFKRIAEKTPEAFRSEQRKLSR